MDQLRCLQDRLDIVELFARYCHALDERDGDGVADCFIPEGLFMSDFSGETRGKDAIRDLTLAKKKRPLYSRRHFFLNPVLELDGDRATFKAYLLGTWVKDGKTEVAVTGRYFGTVVRYQGRWLFEERHVSTDGKPAAWGAAPARS